MLAVYFYYTQHLMSPVVLHFMIYFILFTEMVLMI